MKVLNIHEVGDVRLDDYVLPEAGPKDVVVKMKAVGICGSDLSYIKFGGIMRKPGGVTPIGHEGAVEVPLGTMLTSEMTITTAVGYPTEMNEVVASMARLKDKIQTMISHRVPFDNVLEGLKLAGTPESAKVMVHMEEAGA